MLFYHLKRQSSKFFLFLLFFLFFSPLSLSLAQEEEYWGNKNEGWGFQLQTSTNINHLHFNFMANYIHKIRPQLLSHRFVWYLGHEFYTHKNDSSLANIHEEGNGWGIGFEWRYYLRHPKHAFLGLRGDLWALYFLGKELNIRRDVYTFRPLGVLGVNFGNRISYDITLSIGTDIKISPQERNIYRTSLFLLLGFQMHFS